MSSIEDQIIDGNVVKEAPSEDHSLRVSMVNLRLRDDSHHTRGRWAPSDDRSTGDWKCWDYSRKAETGSYSNQC